MNGASLQVPRVEAENRIAKQTTTGRHLLQTSTPNEAALSKLEAETQAWIRANVALLTNLVGGNDLVRIYDAGDEPDWSTSNWLGQRWTHRSFDRAQAKQYAFVEDTAEARANEIRLSIEDHIVRLEVVASQLELYPESLNLPMYDGSWNHQAQHALANRVFIAHGHDHEARQAVAHYVEKLDCVPIILDEQPNQGRTIIEKFEEYANVEYVIVLLTPDDVGAVKSLDGDTLERDKLTYRARQNVIFELGYFYGKLGRHRVCALVKDRVEFPSDFSGVLWVRMDPQNEWKFSLAREMRAAGLNVDLNRLV